MQALTQNRYGGPETLSLTEVPVPTPGADEVLIRVRAASVNAADVLLMRGTPLIARLAFGLRRPRIAIKGRDVAGIVEAVGASVTTIAVGDEVMAESGTGTFADYTVVAASRAAPKPSVSFAVASTLPIAGTTALQATRAIAPGDRVLIVGASGGVGFFALQLAAHLGGIVTAVVSSRNTTAAQEFGAVIDYTRTSDLGGPYDVILDIAGTPLPSLRAALSPTGTLVLVSGSGSLVFGPIGRIIRASFANLFTRQTLRALTSSANGADLASLGQLVDSGAITPQVTRTFPLADAPDALRTVEAGFAGHKLVVTVGD